MSPLLYTYLFRYQAFIRTEAALNQVGMSMSQNLVHDAWQFLNEVNDVDRNLWNLNDDTMHLFLQIRAILLKSVPLGMRAVGEAGGPEVGGSCGGGLSFEASTKVATAQGEQAIGTLKVGEKVWAYNPKTHTMELQPIVHVWINHDNDLVDLTLTVQTHAPPSTVTHNKSEVVHINQKHPFLTVEHGFLPVAQVTVGMHIERADGSVGIVTAWKLVPGAKTMYNLEVAQDHTFAVGAGQWIVHNCGSGNSEIVTNHSDYQSAFDAAKSHLPADFDDGAVRTQAKGLGGNPLGVQGLDNGMRNGQSYWRLDYDPEKGIHFNWGVGKKSDPESSWGAETFPGTADDYVNLLLSLFNE